MPDSREKRVFLGLPLPGPLKAAAEVFIRRTSPKFSSTKWSDPEGLHITLHFFGLVSPERLSVIRSAASQTASRARPFELGLEGLGFFPKADHPNILWAAPAGDLLFLKDLQADLCARLRAEGFTVEDRPFHPHVTLGRIKGARQSQPLPQEWTFPKTPAVRISEMALFESVSTPAGSRYEILEKFPFA